jgi:hypothetical protein
MGAASVSVYASALSPRAILAAVKEGRVIVMRDTTVAVPRFNVKKGSTMVEVGEEMAVRKGEELELEVIAHDFRGGRVDFVWNGKPLASRTIEMDERAELRWNPDTDGYLRAHLHDGSGLLVAITNPIYVMSLKRQGASRLTQIGDGGRDAGRP